MNYGRCVSVLTKASAAESRAARQPVQLPHRIWSIIGEMPPDVVAWEQHMYEMESLGVSGFCFRICCVNLRTFLPF